jgi:hypothetical protein
MAAMSLRKASLLSTSSIVCLLLEWASSYITYPQEDVRTGYDPGALSTRCYLYLDYMVLETCIDRSLMMLVQAIWAT